MAGAQQPSVRAQRAPTPDAPSAAPPQTVRAVDGARFVGARQVLEPESTPEGAEVALAGEGDQHDRCRPNSRRRSFTAPACSWTQGTPDADERSRPPVGLGAPRAASGRFVRRVDRSLVRDRQSARPSSSSPSSRAREAGTPAGTNARPAPAPVRRPCRRPTSVRVRLATRTLSSPAGRPTNEQHCSRARWSSGTTRGVPRPDGA
jgi:hypothetical protein